MKNTNKKPRQVTAFDICSKKIIEAYVEGKLTTEEARKVRGMLNVIPELQNYEYEVERKQEKEGRMEVALSDNGKANLMHMLTKLRQKKPTLLLFPILTFFQDLGDQLRPRKTTLIRLFLAGVFFCGLTLLPVNIDATKPPLVTGRIPVKYKAQSPVENNLIASQKTIAKQGLPGKPASIPHAPLGKNENPELITTQAMFSKQEDSLNHILPTAELSNPVLTQKENKAPLRIIATDLPSSLSQVFQQPTVGWPSKLAGIAPLKKSYAKAKRSYQKLAQKLAEYSRDLKNKRREMNGSSSNKKLKNNRIGEMANRFRKGQGLGPNKRQKAKMRRIAQRKRKRAKKQGRKKVRWRTQMNALKREMRDLQKQVLKQTLTLLVVKQAEPVLLQVKNAFTLDQVEGLMLGFALPEQIQEPLQFKLYTLDRTATQPKQLLLQAALKTNAQGVVQQFVVFKEHRLSAKSDYMIIEIVKKRKKYRDERLVSYRFRITK